MAIPSPTSRVDRFDSLVTGRLVTGSEFSLATTRRRYEQSTSLPSDSPTRALRAFEYITALEEALAAARRSERGAA